MKLVISRTLFILAGLTGVTKDLVWGEWLQNNPTIFNSTVIPDFLKKYLPLIVIVVFVLSSLYELYLHLDNSPLNKIKKNSIKKIHKDIFISKSPNVDEFNRVTLFTIKPWWKIIRFMWRDIKCYHPFSNYLVISTRTGKHPMSLTSFKVDGDKQINLNGIAGLAWYDSAKVHRLIDLDPDNIENYCDLTRISKDTFNNLNQKSKFFTAFCIESNGKKVGVLIIDSINEHNITDKKIFEFAKNLSIFYEGDL